MQRAFVDQYRYLRDNAKPVMSDLRPSGSKRDPRAGYDRDCDAIADLHDFCAPSKGLRKRVLRVRPEVTPAGPPRDTSRKPLPPTVDFFNQQMRIMRGLV